MKMTTEAEHIVVLEEQLEDEVRCSGRTADPMSPTIQCTNPAVLISYGHGCPDGTPIVKCMSCWQQWYAFMVEKSHAHGGYNVCSTCWQRFYQISDLSDYRPL